jgi:4-hydroxybutyrate dehydrogenase
MKALMVGPEIYCFDTVAEFVKEFSIGEKDLVLTSERFSRSYFEPLNVKTNIVLKDKFGTGEPSDAMIDGIVKESQRYEFERIIALGGGSTLDIAKIVALAPAEKSQDFYLGNVAPRKAKELILVSTTCGTGSEVTNISVAEIKSIGTKKGLQTNELYGDYAILIAETLSGLSYKNFITSSIDALIHAIESFLSPKSNEFVDLFALRAIQLIMEGYKKIIEGGEDARFGWSKEFLSASTFAGIAFGNAGTAAVHACAMTFGGMFHVAHGEANYQFFTEIFKAYMRRDSEGKIKRANEIFRNILGVGEDADIYDELGSFLNKLIAKNRLRDYGMAEDQIDALTDSTIENQQRLLVNSYVPLARDEIRSIYSALY